jgi:hypothetical protein
MSAVSETVGRLMAVHGPVRLPDDELTRVTSLTHALHRALVLHATGIDLDDPRTEPLLLVQAGPAYVAGSPVDALVTPGHRWVAREVQAACLVAIEDEAVRVALRAAGVRLSAPAVRVALGVVTAARARLWRRVAEYAVHYPSLQAAARTHEELRTLAGVRKPARGWPKAPPVTPDVRVLRDALTDAEHSLAVALKRWRGLLDGIEVDLPAFSPRTV